MRLVRILSLASVAALATVCLVAGSASAVTVCKKNEETCKAENRYPAGTELSAELREETQAVFKTALFTVKCEESTFNDVLLEESGKPLLDEITTFTFSKCEGCKAVTVENLPWHTELEQDVAKKGNGILMITKGEGGGRPDFEFAGCPLGASCVYGEGKITLNVHGGDGGEAAKRARVVAAEEVLLRKEGNPLCGATATWSAEYDIIVAKEPNEEAVVNPPVWVAPSP